MGNVWEDITGVTAQKKANKANEKAVNDANATQDRQYNDLLELYAQVNSPGYRFTPQQQGAQNTLLPLWVGYLSAALGRPIEWDYGQDIAMEQAEQKQNSEYTKRYEQWKDEYKGIDKTMDDWKNLDQQLAAAGIEMSKEDRDLIFGTEEWAAADKRAEKYHPDFQAPEIAEHYNLDMPIASRHYTDKDYAGGMYAKYKMMLETDIPEFLPQEEINKIKTDYSGMEKQGETLYGNLLKSWQDQARTQKGAEQSALDVGLQNSVKGLTDSNRALMGGGVSGHVAGGISDMYENAMTGRSELERLYNQAQNQFVQGQAQNAMGNISGFAMGQGLGGTPYAPLAPPGVNVALQQPTGGNELLGRLGSLASMYLFSQMGGAGAGAAGAAGQQSFDPYFMTSYA